jgi:3-hydroxy-9,10-secoandrosta-1,3,5(10)-triene-9,17-dione monooxygenase
MPNAVAAENRQMTYIHRARVRMDTGYVAETARHAMDILLSAHGASSFAEASPLQRMWRDLETCSRHAVVSPEISSEVYGKALLGIEGGVTALV